MLLGEGGKSISTQHSSMTAARIACSSCHQVKEVSPTGTVLWRASTEVCTQCHDVSATERLQAHHEQMKGSLKEIQTEWLRVDEAFRVANLDETRAAEIEKTLGELEDDLNFIRVGNGIHNIHYATSLIRELVNQLSEICRELNIEEPQVALPAQIDLLE
jgi:predicted CXXCH cytochrome family protein